MKKKRGIEIKINISNRWIYTLIVIGVLAIVGVGVYAATYTASGAGHPYTEISTCSVGQILKMNSAGTAWECSTISGTTQWTTSGNDIYYNTGNVGIGTNDPETKLDVDGYIRAKGRIYVGAGEYFYQGGRNIIQTTSSIISSTTIQGNLRTMRTVYRNGDCPGEWGAIAQCTVNGMEKLCICEEYSGNLVWRYISTI